MTEVLPSRVLYEQMMRTGFDSRLFECECQRYIPGKRTHCFAGDQLRRILSDPGAKVVVVERHDGLACFGWSIWRLRCPRIAAGS